jgi:cytochrome c oxidase cbb3-type subunit 3
MSEQNEEKSTGHVYDGIEELDNRLPNWWLGTLYGTILFAIGYSAYYLVGNGPTLVREYERDRDEALYAEYLKGGDKKKGPTEEALLAIFKDDGRRKEGQGVFSSRCIACHGDHGQGGIGPNLTDEYWLHGGRLVQIAGTITAGVAEKGMPPWGPILKDREVESVVAYIRSLKATHPAGAKAPQGQKEL